MKKLILISSFVLLILCCNNVFANNVKGWERLQPTIERVTGRACAITGSRDASDKNIILTVQTEGWANGDWNCMFCDEKPDTKSMKGSVWYCFYDENMHRLGYVLAYKINPIWEVEQAAQAIQVVAVATNSSTSIPIATISDTDVPVQTPIAAQPDILLDQLNNLGLQPIGE